MGDCESGGDDEVERRQMMGALERFDVMEVREWSWRFVVSVDPTSDIIIWRIR